MRWLLVLLSIVSALLAGCSSTGTRTENAGRYSISKDRGPSEYRDVAQIPDAVPQVMPYSKWGNKTPYEVWGKTYTVMPSHIGYRAEGLASWYGEKFHGHRTSSGDDYDLYGMSAAHKSLPIPSFAKVTNLDNGRSVIVKVNDRGPFHEDRLIDLSYAAAAKLGYADKGTARVRVESIDAAKWQRDHYHSSVATSEPLETSTGLTAVTLESKPVAPIKTSATPRMGSSSASSLPAVSSTRVVGAPAPVVASSKPTLSATSAPLAAGNYLQVAAFSSAQAADQLSQRLKLELGEQRAKVDPAEVNGQTLYRVKIGPLREGEDVSSLSAGLEGIGLSQPYLVKLP
ncbi:hypothetical protein WH50_15670 [Pokkaliibacter plantistimulans]|uniref:Endolytic peptidoglycan transglycosylase RlpA n=1 Tax=Pokkaliibacter plantistimulans TaxID=1635171 RepID=A0ABX5LUQ0_9GAMM|nr:septal ring lytic transglycosylase RlpA family protein [Pokkaliibacter plantistimulans]PXF30372.1 hypothetical protein WH50_15670 [Pokkaliibacter plantistimulans]